MKRILTIALVAAGFAASAQQTIMVTPDNKSEVIRDVVTAQYDAAASLSAQYDASAFAAMSGESGQSGATMSGFTYGDDKYLKTKKDGTRYEDFQVYDTRGKDKEDVMVGLMTGTLDRGIRYNELGETEEKISLVKGDVEILKVQSADLTAGMQEKIAGFRVKDKFFVILGKDDYRYIDGKALVGGKPVVSEMKKGKPITAITFFYELQKAGIAEADMTVKEFLSLSTNQQQEIVNDGSLASN